MGLMTDLILMKMRRNHSSFKSLLKDMVKNHLTNSANFNMLREASPKRSLANNSKIFQAFTILTLLRESTRSSIKRVSKSTLTNLETTTKILILEPVNVID